MTLRQTVLFGSHQRQTAIAYWRSVSDTIIERTFSRGTAAFEYQLGTERVVTDDDV